MDEKKTYRRGHQTPNRPQGRAPFFLMSLVFRLRDLIHPPLRILQNMSVASGASVLDFGCGPGAFSIAASRLAGPGGKVFAVDINPLALSAVRRAADKKQLLNITAIVPADLNLIPQNSIDVIIMFDVLHLLPDPITVLDGLYHLLNPDGILAVSDHHMNTPDILDIITANGVFALSHECPEQPKYYCFRRNAHG